MSSKDEAMGASNLALALVGQGNVAAGLALHRRAVAADPDWRWKIAAAGDLINHGYVDAAADMLAQCPAREPVVMAVNGFVALERGDLDAAIGLLGVALKLNPHGPGWRVALAQALLAKGSWDKGFPLYECRESRNSARLGTDIPRWDGKHVDRLLVWADEGMGDAVMLARFIPELAKRVGRVVFGLPPALLGLLGAYEAHAEILNLGAMQELRGEAMVSAECALMSAPMYCGATPDTVPADPRLLRCANVNGTLTEMGKRNVGIAWTGNPGFLRAHLRDMDFETMLGLAEDPDNRLFGLVVGSRAADISKAGAQALVTDMSGLIMADFQATAAAVRAMDCVVTTCNGVAHIAGALGVPTFLCLATFPDWRWLRGRDTTPWYPSVKLFRQRSPREWGPVIAEVRERLAALPVKGVAPAPLQGRWGDRKAWA